MLHRLTLILFVSLGLITVADHAFAQRGCCYPPGKAMNNNIDFMASKEFANAHMNPLPFTGAITQGENITFTCSDGKDGSAFVVASKVHPKDVILMFHEWWGLNDYIKQEAVRLSDKLGVTVIAIDLYDGNVATTREDAQKYVQGMKKERGLAIIGGAYDYFPATTHFATIGWCFGGGWSMQAALNPTGNITKTKRLKGCVMYYGQPETVQANLKRLHCPVLGIFGTQDQWLNPKLVAGFQVAMKKAKKSLKVYSYDADHAFANPSNPKFNKAASEDAMKHTEAFLKKAFGI